MGHRHRVFVSFHHALDQDDYRQFRELFHDRAEAIVDESVQDGDIDPNDKTDNTRRIIREKYLRDTTVTVVLVGRETWQRKHVDWEIGASIRQTAASSRSGLLGILLPSYSSSNRTYDPHTIPPRLWDNVECGFAKMYRWTDRADHLQAWVHEAFERRRTVQPDNSRVQFARNRSGDRWRD